MQFRILSTVAGIIGCIFATEASATIYSLTWNGIVDSSSDDTGVFGIVHNGTTNANAYAGLTYTATYLFDSSLGTDLGGANELARGGGTSHATVSPILSASVTVNGHTVNLTGQSAGEVQVREGTTGGARYSAEDDPTSLRQLILTSAFTVSGGTSMPLSFGPYTFNSLLGNGLSQFSESDIDPVTFHRSQTLVNDEFLNFSVSVLDASATPLPGALPLFVSGLGTLGLLGWRRKRKATAA